MTITFNEKTVAAPLIETGVARQSLSTASRHCELIMEMPGDGFRGTLLIFYGEAATRAPRRNQFSSAAPD